MSEVQPEVKPARPAISPALAEKPAKPQPVLLRRNEQPKALRPGNFQAAGYARAHFNAILPSGWDFEEVLKPAFWSNIVGQLKKNPAAGEREDRIGARIDLLSEDHSFYAELYVRAVMQRGLVVQCVGPSVDPKTGMCCPVDLMTRGPWKGEQPIKSEEYDAKWNVGKRGFDIIRKSDQQIVGEASKFPTKELALAEIAQLSK